MKPILVAEGGFKGLEMVVTGPGGLQRAMHGARQQLH